MFTQDFEYLLAVRDVGNITKAANILHIAQPSLSQKIQRMEAELGCSLLQRLPSGVRLTQAGEYYCQMAEQVLRLHQDFLYKIAKMKELSFGTLRIGASWYITTTFLPKLISNYKNLYPNIEIDLVENRSSILLEELRSGKLDISFVSNFPYGREIGSKFCFRQMNQDPFCLAASRNLNLQKLCHTEDSNIIPLEKLEKLPFIMFHEKQHLRTITDHILTAAGIKPQTSITTNGFPMAIEQVSAGHGVVIMPKAYLDSVRKRYDLDVFDIDEKYHAFWNNGFCYYHLPILSPPLKSFLDLISEFIPHI